MTRVQRERFFNEEDYIRLRDSYILTAEKLSLAPVSYTHLGFVQLLGKLPRKAGGRQADRTALRQGIQPGCYGLQAFAPAPAEEPVSYTHLDVYKRQAENRLRPAGSHCRVWQRPAHLPDHGQRVL